jgi:cathepsin L
MFCVTISRFATAISVDAMSWGAYESGIYAGCNQASPDIDHAVVLVGYGEEVSGAKYWLVRNSWSPSWGERGYIRVSRTDSEEDTCAMDVTPHDGSACAGEDEAVKVRQTSALPEHSHAQVTQ